MRHLSRFRRRIIAVVAIGGLLFAQAAIAVYYCELPAPAPGVMDNCTEMEAGGDIAAACQAHCHPPGQSFEQARLPVFAPMRMTILAVSLVGPCGEPSAFPAQRLLARSGSPPHAILHCSFLT